MSVRIMSAVWQNAPHVGGTLLVLLALADWCDDDGYCWPSVPTIASKARLGERQVQRVLAQFRAAGIVTVEKGGGRGVSNRYQLHPETLTPMSPKSESETMTPTSPKRGERVTSTTEKGDICGSAIRKNHQEPSKDILSNADASDPSPKPPRDGKARDAKAARWVFDYYVQALGRNPKTYLYTPKRQGMINGRLKETVRMCGDRKSAVNFLAKCINSMTESDWHMGRDPKTNGRTYNELENVFGPSKFQQWVSAVERAEQEEPDADEVGAFQRSQEKAETLQ